MSFELLLNVKCSRNLNTRLSIIQYLLQIFIIIFDDPYVTVIRKVMKFKNFKYKKVLYRSKWMVNVF